MSSNIKHPNMDIFDNITSDTLTKYASAKDRGSTKNQNILQQRLQVQVHHCHQQYHHNNHQSISP